MKFSAFPSVLTNSIWVDREARQRREVNVEDLVPSIRLRGILMPLIVEAHHHGDNTDYKLIAGERRLTAAIELGLTEVPIRLVEDLEPDERQIIELEENVKRHALSWQDEARAVLRIHTLYSETNEDWSPIKTAAVVCLSERHVSRLLDVATELERGDDAVAKCDGVGAAITMLSRRRERQRGEALNKVLSLGGENLRKTIRATRSEEDVVDDEEDEGFAEPPKPDAPPFEIICADAFEFFESYSDTPFNFLHIDFPYGVVLNEQANQGSFEEGYHSDEKTYWKLCQALADNFDRLALPSAHLMFWFSFEFRDETLAFFQAHPKTRKIEWQNIPIIWHKTDNRGILSDPMRRPRNIGEYALIGACSDRHLVKPKANIYGAPTDKTNSIHTNEKPEPMLAHFFEMFVDEHSRVFDPTAGSGSAIRVAERLGAECGLGLEFNPELARRAQAKLEERRNMKKLSDKLEGRNVA